MSEAVLIDFCCCDGGASMGYHRAGFRVIGVDVNPQPLYPFEFVQGDALQLLPELVQAYRPLAVVGSPPCQAYSPLNAYNHKIYPDLIAPLRQAMIATGLPYVIENVEAAASELRDPIMLCGPMFGLNVYRHRLFESNLPLAVPAHASHVELCTRNGYLPTPAKPFMSIHGGKHSRAWVQSAAKVMGVEWMVGPDTKASIRAVCESIPPAYTEWIGNQLMASVRLAAAS